MSDNYDFLNFEGITIFDFGEKEKERNLRVPTNFLYVIMESMNVFKELLEKDLKKAEDHENIFLLERKIEQLDEYMDVVQGKADFKFNKMLAKCKLKGSSCDLNEIGQDPMLAAQNKGLLEKK